MNLKILTKATENSTIGYIGKTGILRIKKRDILKLGIASADRWFLSFDLDEGVNKKHIYLLRTIDNNTTFVSKKMTITKNGLFLDLNILISESKIKIPSKCTIEQFNEEEYQGLRIKLI